MRSLLKPLIIFSATLASCSHKPVNTHFDSHWEMCQPTPFAEKLACLPEADVKALSKILIECKAATTK